MTRSNLRLILFAFAVILACGCLVSQAAYADAQDLRAGTQAEYTVKGAMIDQKADLNADADRAVIERRLTKEELHQQSLFDYRAPDYVKGPYLGRPNEVRDARAQGDDISDPWIISSLPYDTISTTGGFTDDYDEAIPYASTSPDVVFEFTPGADATIEISLCSPNTLYDTKVFVYLNTAGTFIAGNEDAGAALCAVDQFQSIITEMCVQAGETYYIVVDGYGGDFGQYELSVQEITPNPSAAACGVTLPAIDVAETKSCFGEPDPNGGLNEAGTPTDPLTIGQTVGGTVWSAYQFRDTDWYLFTLGAAENLRFFGASDMPDFRIVVVDEATGGGVYFEDIIIPSSCTEDTLELYGVPAGSYYLIILPNSFLTDYYCCDGSEPEYEYWVSTETFTPVVSPGDNCGDPIVINYAGSYSDLGQTTCGRVNDYDATALGLYDGGEDIIYELNIAAATTVNINLTTASTYTGLAVFETCPPGATSVAQATGSAGNKSLNCLDLNAGTYYIMVDTWPTPDCIPSFDLTISDTTCVATPGDDCGDPIVINYTGSYSDLGQTTCGRGDDYNATALGSYDGGEDIIYELNIAAATQLNIRVTSASSWIGMGLFATCPPGASSIAQVTSSAGSKAITCLSLNPGTYYLMLDTWPSPTCIPSFDLAIYDSVGCPTPPVNDACGGSITVFDGLNTGYDNVGAGDGPAAPSGCGSTMLNDVWFDYITTCGNVGGPYGDLIVNTEGSTFDTKLAAYLGNPDCSSLLFIVCNDDISYPANVQSQIVISGIEPGLPLYFQVAGYAAADEGDIDLFIDCQDPPPPPCNDECANLLGVPCPGYGAGIPVLTPGVGQSYSGDNSGATANDCALLDPVVWEAFTIDTCMDITVDYAGSGSPGVPFGNAYIILSGACPCDGNFFFYTSFGFGPDGNVIIQYYDVPAGTWYIPVLKDVASDASGPYQIEVTGEICPPYCRVGANSDFEYIERVQLNTIDNVTGPEPGGYGDYTSVQTLVYKGAGYPATVTVNGPYSTDVVGAWVDWDLDFVFNGVTEFISFVGGNDVDPTAEAVVNVPLSAVVGVTTMRIQLVDAGFDPLDPCGNVGAYGEYEDYGLIVEDLPCGDVNVDDNIDGADVQYLIDFYFNQGPAPLPILENGDTNGDCCVGIADIVYLAEHVYRQGPDPICLPCQAP